MEDDGMTALHRAVQQGDVDMVRELLSLNVADVNAQSQHGLTPLHTHHILDV
jgi:ankyrin repeat protein